jgi:hypothetical protein
MKTIIVTFNGSDTKIETCGFTGSECLKETLDLKRELGLTDVEETPTRESYARTDTRQEVRRGR